MTRSQATPASSQIIALEGMVQRLEQRVVVQQARIAELRGALESVKAQRIDGFMFPAVVDLNAWHTRVINALAKPDDLSALNDLKAQYEACIAEMREGITTMAVQWSSKDHYDMLYVNGLLKADDLSALEAIKRQARREALMEAADYVFDLDVDTSLFAIQTQLRRMAGEVKP